ncbi:HET-domain-containing protein, partial [Patellaria atrata CBS 101060]
MSLAAAWLKECATEHDDCSHHGRTVPALPSRVIDVSDPVRPVLKIPHWERKPYVTLSYCWGDSARFMTRKENLEEHKKRLPLESMPKTFRDAIAVTVRLGFRYLWIDAICLVQDWPEDVERGMSNMGAIYRDSFLTISAAGGINVEAGLFVDRDPRWYRPCRLDMNVHATGYSVTRTFYIHGRTIESYLPLNSRGWVLQEQASSRRSLIFGRRMMWWQCACRSLSEEEPRKSSANESNFLATFRIWAIEPKALEKLNQMKSNHFDVWYDIVEKYQTRSLTFITDKLPALSGLAGLLHKRYRCTYLAGLWREDLQVGLCW